MVVGKSFLSIAICVACDHEQIDTTPHPQAVQAVHFLESGERAIEMWKWGGDFGR